MNDEKFEKNLKQLILNWYKESMNTNNTYVYNPLTKLDINKDFIDDIGNIFKNQNNIITSIENINVIFIIGIILFLTVLTGFITNYILSINNIRYSIIDYWNCLYYVEI